MKRAVVAVAAVLLLGACTGVPSSSAPQTVEPLQTPGATAGPTASPSPNADPLTIVQSFLAANPTNADGDTLARAYLTSAARNRWSDNTATIVADDYSVSTYDATTRSVTVFGRVLGTLNAAGVYTPSLQGIGEGGPRRQFRYTLTKAAGQNRIDQLPNGLLLSDQQFRATFQQQVLYFYDASETYLVPDLRWSALGDRGELASWLLTQLVTGARPELQNAVNTDTLPTQADARNLTVHLGSPTRIEIPGSSLLAPAVRDRLAAQVGYTLFNTLSEHTITVTDGGKAVQIPSVGGIQFSAADFPSARGPSPPDPAVYYLVNGQVHTENGKPLSGALSDRRYFLFSVALARPHPAGPLYVAGVQGTGDTARLLVGTTEGLRATGVKGELSRPAFAPGRAEVWIGVGSNLYRVTTDGTLPRSTQVPMPPGSGGGRVVAVRISPDGSRIAIVVSGAKASTAQLYVGSIVRGSGQVRVDAMQPVSPEGVVVRDVAWLDSSKLFAIGAIAATNEPRTFETGVDGTEWTNLGIGNLSYPPDSLTTTAEAPAVWVSSNGYVWKQESPTQWVSPGPTGQTPGRMPVYLS
ncbi:MAG: LpqB family beta-propeller domain-containing protein [Jatrophihabitans sp.]|uniref:LpqB family beta-propeller domain-containing protein n=1 Tax=Jatrophihabitans sp. TaxID=1932789 RepID=UPI003913CB13